jgi:hypothetical protein
MLMCCFVCVAEEVSEELAGRMPGVELHHLKEQSSISFWGSLSDWCFSDLYVLC